jgi:hypothetical protein
MEGYHFREQRLASLSILRETGPCKGLKYAKAVLCKGLKSGQDGQHEVLKSGEQTNVLYSYSKI